MIDCHVHLNELEDVEAALERARQAGVCALVGVGMEVASNQITLELARRHPGVIYPALGYHPWAITAENVKENLDFLREHLPQAAALGEVGLDYQAKARKKLQQEILEELLEMAALADKPVILHTRFSQARTHRMVREAGIRRAVFHWYSGPLEVLEMILADGFLISATPALAYSPPHQAAVLRTPLEQLLLETDAPVEYQGRVSEPADLRFTAAEVSRLKGVELSRVVAVTTANARRFLGLPEEHPPLTDESG